MKGFVISFCMIAFVGVGCRQFSSRGSSSSEPPSRPSTASSPAEVALTKDKVQPLVDRLAAKYKSSECGRKQCKAEVVSVREIPSQNQAVATLDFVDFVYKRTGRTEEYIYTGEGKAILEKGTNGQWSMTQLEMTKYGEGWKWSEMRGYDVQ